MTRNMLMTLIDDYTDENGDVDIYEMMRDIEEAREQRIEELEERQHQSGFYAFQDAMEMWRRER